MKYLLVFGSLRKNSRRGYNFNRFGGQRYIGEFNLSGFEMVSLGAYPAICEGKGKVKVELHEVEDESFKSIYRMEIGAGYYEKTINFSDKIIEGGLEASVFVMDKENLNRYPKVKSGDWI